MLLELGDTGRAVFSRDGRFVARCLVDGNSSVWDVSRRALTRAFKPATRPIIPLALFANGTRLVFYSDADHRLFDWDLSANREIQSWPAPADLDATGLSPDERQVITIGFDGDVQVRNLAEQSGTSPHLSILAGLIHPSVRSLLPVLGRRSDDVGSMKFGALPPFPQSSASCWRGACRSAARREQRRTSCWKA